MVMTPCSAVNLEVHRPLHTQEASLGCVGISTAEVVEGLQQEADANSEARSSPVQERLGQTWKITERLDIQVRQDVFQTMLGKSRREQCIYNFAAYGLQKA